MAPRGQRQSTHATRARSQARPRIVGCGPVWTNFIPECPDHATL